MFSFIFSLLISIGLPIYIIYKLCIYTTILPNNPDIVVNKMSDKLLDSFIIEVLNKYNFNKYKHINKIAFKRFITTLIFSFIMFLYIVLFFIYHRITIESFYFIGIVVLIIYLVILHKMSTIKELKKQIKASPDDDMEYIIAGSIQNVDNTKVNIYTIFGFLSIAVAFIVPLIIFNKPMMIYEKNSDGYAIRFYTYSLNTPHKVVIPEEHNGLPVTEIRGNVFQNIKEIEEVKLPSTLKIIRARAFSNTGLISIDLPLGLNEIGAYAFSNTNLRNVEIPNSVFTLGGGAFQNCYNLESVKLSELLSEIRGNTFQNSGIREIDIPYGVTRIGGHAFHGCSRLSHVTLPNTLTEIGSSAFRECSSLYEITIPSGAYVNERAFKESPTWVTYR